MTRPYIPLEENEELRQEIEDYAARHGLRLPRAYIELLQYSVENIDDNPEEITNEPA